jgi:hypothetical protein
MIRIKEAISGEPSLSTLHQHATNNYCLFAESRIQYFENKASGQGAEQCKRALEVLSASAGSPCRPLYLSLANFWSFLHSWKSVADQLNRGLGEHSAMRLEAKRRQPPDGGREDLDLVRLLKTFFETIYFSQVHTMTMYIKL